MTDSSAVERLKEYKGTSFPNPIIPLSGLALGLSLPFAIKTRLLPEEWSELSPQDSFLVLFQSFFLVGLLFFLEFAMGAAARSTSSRASFSPAAAQAAGAMPFVLVQANRIHQNHIESIAIFAPMALAATAAGVNVCNTVACTIAWFVSRLVYRVGYCNATNPFWRICGTTASMIQSIICACLFVSSKL